MSRAQQIHIQPNRSRHARRQLPEECVSGVDVRAFAVLRAQQPAFLRFFSGIMACQQRPEMIVPLIHEVQAAFLHPTVEVALRDLVGIMKDTVFGSQHIHRRFFDRNPLLAQLRGIRREVCRC